jgi:hypothetical protein
LAKPLRETSIHIERLVFADEARLTQVFSTFKQCRKFTKRNGHISLTAQQRDRKS